MRLVRVLCPMSDKIPTHSGFTKVLVVDDDPLIHVIFKKVAAKSGISLEIDGSLQPKNGLEKLSQFKPDILLLDINMPQMSGWDFLEAMKSDSSGCDVYMYSSSIDPSDKNRALSFPQVKEFIVKPITADKLAQLIH
jgi:CheY-like chemotaxis protein